MKKKMSIKIRKGSPRIRVQISVLKIGFLITIAYLGDGERYAFHSEHGYSFGPGNKDHVLFIIWEGGRYDNKNTEIVGSVEVHGTDIPRGSYQYFHDRCKETDEHLFVKTDLVYPCDKDGGWLGYDEMMSYQPKTDKQRKPV